MRFLAIRQHRDIGWKFCESTPFLGDSMPAELAEAGEWVEGAHHGDMKLVGHTVLLAVDERRIQEAWDTGAYSAIVEVAPSGELLKMAAENDRLPERPPVVKASANPGAASNQTKASGNEPDATKGNLFGFGAGKRIAD
jgi:hypothetical protein